MESEAMSYDQFEFGDLIGQGSSGVVKKAYHKAHDKKEFAIKILNKDYSYKREAETVKILSEIKIPFVVEFYGHFVRENQLYIVMEYCQFGDLRKEIQAHVERAVSLDDAKVKRWSLELLLVMFFMQQNNIVHNDIKPENILIDKAKGSIKLADVGQAQFINDYKSLSTMAGTTAYMAPERNLSNGQACSASDLWSCGVVFYEMVYLKLPFEKVQDFLDKRTIDHDVNRPVGKLFKPIFDGIFVQLPNERLKLEEILTLLRGESLDTAKNTTADQRKLARLLKLTSVRIQDSFPKIQTEKSMSIMDVSLIEKDFKHAEIVMLLGVAGAGKTTLALEYAEDVCRRKNAVVVVFNEHSIDDQLRKILIEDLEQDKTSVSEMNERQIIDAINKHIDGQKTLHLFVFDNVESKQMNTVKLFSDTMPSKLNILLTSRNVDVNKELSLRMSTLQMSPVSESEAKQYLVDRMSSRLEKRTIERIFNEVVRVERQITPYYLKNMVNTLEMFIEKHDGIDAEELDSVIDQLKSMDVTDFMVQNLAGNDECLRVLEVVQFLDPDEISMYVLRLLVGGPREAVNQAVKLLKKYQIFTEFSLNDKTFVRVHRLVVESVKKSSRKRDEAKHRANRTRIVETLLAELKDIDIVSPENMRKVKLVKKHIAQLLDESSQMERSIHDLFQTMILIEEKYYKNTSACVKHLERLLKLCQNTYGPSQEDFFSIFAKNRLSVAYISDGNVEKAIQLQKETIAIIDRLAPDKRNHMLRVWGLSNLAHFYSIIGDYAEALRLYRQTYELNKSYYKDEPNTMTANELRNVARMHVYLGDTHEGLRTFEQALQMYREALGEKPDDANVAQSLYEMAMAYAKMKKFAQAIETQEKGVEIRRRIHGDQPDHTEIAEALNDLASLHVDIGEHERARDLLNRALEMRRRFFARSNGDHLDVVKSLNKLGAFYCHIKSHTEAIEAHREALEMCRRISLEQQPNHRILADTLYGLASAYLSAGKLTQALELFQECLELRRMIYSQLPDHPDVAVCVNRLGDVHKDMGNYEQAIEFYQQALEMRQRFYRDQPNHSAIAESWSSISLVHIARGELREAVKFFRKSVDMLQLFYKNDPYNPELAQKMSALASAYYEVGDYSEAIKMYESVLEIWDPKSDDKQPPGRPDLAKLLLDLATAYYRANNYSMGIERQKESLELQRKALAPDDPEILANLKSLGFAYLGQRRYSDALEVYEELLAKERRIHQDVGFHSDVAGALNYLGIVCLNLDKNSEAVLYFKECVEMHRAIDQNQPNSMAHLLNNLASAFNSLQDYTDAIRYYEEALDAWQRSGQVDQPFVVHLLNDLGLSYEKAGRLQDALTAYERAFTISTGIFPADPNNELIKKCSANLTRLHELV